MSDLRRRNNLDIIYTMETKNNDEYCERVRRRLKVEKGFYVKSNGLAARLALWWKQDISVIVHHKEEAMIDTTINLNR